MSPCHYDRMGCGAAVVDAPRIAAAVHAEVCAIISGKFDRALAHHKFQLGHALGDVPVFFSVCAAPFSLDAGARIRRVRTIACFGAAAAAAATVASPPPSPSFLLTQLLSWRRQRRRCEQISSYLSFAATEQFFLRALRKCFLLLSFSESDNIAPASRMMERPHLLD